MPPQPTSTRRTHCRKLFLHMHPIISYTLEKMGFNASKGSEATPTKAVAIGRPTTLEHQELNTRRCEKALKHLWFFVEDHPDVAGDVLECIEAIIDELEPSSDTPSVKDSNHHDFEDEMIFPFESNRVKFSNPRKPTAFELNRVRFSRQNIGKIHPGFAWKQKPYHRTPTPEPSASKTANHHPREKTTVLFSDIDWPPPPSNPRKDMVDPSGELRTPKHMNPYHHTPSPEPPTPGQRGLTPSPCSSAPSSPQLLPQRYLDWSHPGQPYFEGEWLTSDQVWDKQMNHQPTAKIHQWVEHALEDTPVDEEAEYRKTLARAIRFPQAYRTVRVHPDLGVSPGDGRVSRDVQGKEEED